MSKRLVVVGGATAVAGLVLGASIVFGPPALTGAGRQLPEGIDAPGVGGTPTGDPGSLTANIREFDYTTFEPGSDGTVRRIRLRAKQTNVKPLGVTELLGPRAEIHLGTQRAITITADKADMVMENEKPRAGQFSGNVVVSLFEAPADTKLVIDPEDPAYTAFLKQRIHLDNETDFSIEDDSIQTLGPVHATSPQADFYGIGLRLIYNTQRERIEQLLISEGRYLLYNPDAEPAELHEQATDEQPQQAAAADDDTGRKPDPQPAGPSQYYHATFLKNVVVRDGIESELAGDTLKIAFSLGTEAVSLQPVTPDQTGAGAHQVIALPYGQLVQADPTRLLDKAPLHPLSPLPLLIVPQRNTDRSLFTYKRERDVVVIWEGPMRITPLAEKPEQLENDEDVHVTLTGPSAYAQTNRNGELERLETTRLEYLLSKEQTTALAGEDKPLRIMSTALGGEIIGQSLSVRQQEGVATILGPGRLTYTDPDTGKPLTLTWTKRLDLELYTEQKGTKPDADAEAQTDTDADTERPSVSGTQTRILGVKTATFDGEVTATHPDFDLAAEKLTLAFAEPNKKLGIDNHPTAINASGSIAIQARGDAPDEVFDISAQRLTIDLSLDDDGDPYASAIRALGQVSVVRPGMQLTCGRVSVELNPPATAARPGNGEADALTQKLSAEVRKIYAIDNVRAKIDREERKIDLVADELVGDVVNNKLTLSSKNKKQLAEVVDIANDRRLTGKLVVMDDQADVLTIVGPGSLAAKIDDPGNPNAGIEDAFLAIEWATSMKFNNVTGEAEFIDAVRSTSRRSTDASELTCNRLDMLFSPDYEHDAQRLVEDAGEDDHERQVRSAVATGDVKFMAAAWELSDTEKINNRLRLEGPKVVFTNRPAIEIGDKPVETVVVEGQGRMVLEDYRAPEKRENNDNEKRAFMTGRGASLFAWDDTMVLDARGNTATLIDGVQMVHIPKDESGEPGATVQLDCDKLVADMTDTGGLSVWLSDDAPDAQVTTITSDGNVRLLQQKLRSIRGDHLKFAAEQENVVIWSEGNRSVVIEDLERDAQTLTNKVTLDLPTGRIEIDELRGGAQPLE